MGNHIFVCYARVDQDFTLELADNLKKRGLPIWLDQWNITPGEDWDAAVDNALDGCVEFVIILSPTAVTRREVRGELRTALDENKTILPILYQDCRIPRQLRVTEYVDFRGYSPSDESVVRKVLSSLKTKTPPPGTKLSLSARAQSASAQTMKTPAPSGSLGASRGTPTQYFLKRYSATGAFKPTITTASSPHVAAVEQAPEPEFYRRWTWWVSLAVIVLLGFGGALLADWLLGHVIGLDMFVIPGKWLAFIMAGILFGVTYVALCVESLSEGDDLIFDLALPMILWSAGGSLIGWGLAVGAAHLAARFLSISPALVGYLVFGAAILSVAGWCIKNESQVSSNLEDWGHWLMAPLLVLFSIGAACLIDWLIGRGLDALRFSVPEMPGKWLAFLLTGVACGVAFLSTRPLSSEVAGIAIGVYGLSKSFAIGWGLALGAAYLVDRYLNISFALVGYIVYGLAIVYGIAMTREQISDA